MALTGTDRGEVALERLKAAREALSSLIEFAESARKEMDQQIQAGVMNAFPPLVPIRTR